MCTNGVNAGQFEQMIDQVDDHLKLERRWAHNLAHQAADAGFAATAEKLHAAQALLDDARALLDRHAPVPLVSAEEPAAAKPPKRAADPDQLSLF